MNSQVRGFQPATNKTRNIKDLYTFRKHRNYVNKLYKRERKNYFNNLNKNDVQNPKKCWDLWKPLISDNYRSQNAITLVNKGNDILSDERKVAK